MAKDGKPPTVNSWPAEGLPLDPTRIAPKLWDDYVAARAAARDVPRRLLWFVDDPSSGYSPDEERRLAQRNQAKAALDAQLRAYLNEDGHELWARHGSPEAPCERVLASVDELKFDHENRTAKVRSLTLYGLWERCQADAKPAAATAPTAIERPTGRQADRVLPVLPELYPPKGVVPPRTSIDRVRGEVAKKLEDDSRRNGLADPSRDVVSNCVKYLRTLHT
jgi:hypothetical protein